MEDIILLVKKKIIFLSNTHVFLSMLPDALESNNLKALRMTDSSSVPKEKIWMQNVWFDCKGVAKIWIWFFENGKI